MKRILHWCTNALNKETTLLVRKCGSFHILWSRCFILCCGAFLKNSPGIFTPRNGASNFAAEHKTKKLLRLCTNEIARKLTAISFLRRKVIVFTFLALSHFVLRGIHGECICGIFTPRNGELNFAAEHTVKHKIKKLLYLCTKVIIVTFCETTSLVHQRNRCFSVCCGVQEKKHTIKQRLYWCAREIVVSFRVSLCETTSFLYWNEIVQEMWETSHFWTENWSLSVFMFSHFMYRTHFSGIKS